jgi:hypothetical protein
MIRKKLFMAIGVVWAVANMAFLYLNQSIYYRHVVIGEDEINAPPRYFEAKGIVLNFPDGQNIAEAVGERFPEELIRLETLETDRKKIEYIHDEIVKKSYRSGPPISLTTWNPSEVVQTKDFSGYCVDLSKLMGVFAGYAGIPYRIWWLRNHVTFEYFDRNKQRWITMDPSYGIRYRLGDRFLSTYELVRAFDRESAVEVVRFSDHRSEFLPFEGLQQQRPRYTDSEVRPYVLDGYGNMYARKSILYAGRLATRVYYHDISPLTIHGRPLLLVANLSVWFGLLYCYRRLGSFELERGGESTPSSSS